MPIHCALTRPAVHHALHSSGCKQIRPDHSTEVSNIDTGPSCQGLSCIRACMCHYTSILHTVSYMHTTWAIGVCFLKFVLVSSLHHEVCCAVLQCHQACDNQQTSVTMNYTSSGDKTTMTAVTTLKPHSLPRKNRALRRN